MRLPDWPSRFDALLQQRLTQPFEWTGNDCVAFSADNVQALRGRDDMAEFRTQRRCWAQARAQLETGGGLYAGLQRAGLERIPVALAGVGDLVLVALGKRRVLAVCNGTEAMSPGRQGLVAVPMHTALDAWRV